MDVNRLEDRLFWGLNRAASILGHITDVYCPSGVSNPLDRCNRFIQLHAAFSRQDGSFTQPVSYGTPMWRGHFDASYTRVGDYLVQQRDIWFIAAQQSLLPVLCVRANRVISISRPVMPTTGAAIETSNSGSMAIIISQWPANVLGTGTQGKSSAQLPGDTTIPTWVALLPNTHQQSFQPTDMVTDDHGVNSVVIAAELSDLGWRLNIRQVTT
jgi:hypothetical protein